MLLNKMNTMATCSGFAKKNVRCRSGYSSHFSSLQPFASHPFYSLLSSIFECDVYSNLLIYLLFLYWHGETHARSCFPPPNFIFCFAKCAAEKLDRKFLISYTYKILYMRN